MTTRPMRVRERDDYEKVSFNSVCPPGLYAHVFASLPDLDIDEGPILAGGAVWKMLLQERPLQGDLDVWFPNGVSREKHSRRNGERGLARRRRR